MLLKAIGASTTYWSLAFTDFGYFQERSAVASCRFCSTETFQKFSGFSQSSSDPEPQRVAIFPFLQSDLENATDDPILFPWKDWHHLDYTQSNQNGNFFLKSLDNNLNFAQNCKRTYDSQPCWWITEQLGLRLPGVTPGALSTASWILTPDPEAQLHPRAKSFCQVQE